MNNLFEYKENLDALHFTPEQKAAIAARAAEAAAAQSAPVCLLYTSPSPRDN